MNFPFVVILIAIATIACASHLKEDAGKQKSGLRKQSEFDLLGTRPKFNLPQTKIVKNRSVCATSNTRDESIEILMIPMVV